ncbi:conserved hypothetical protein [Uncinocarpus reesii 1704]|uniref:Uncharacterized protein n=1 Tax=Uncinocarpus reesii (strain UAMH 1704) TaxID=336963 RepID=C4JFX2_UNCRE|nr:uncharacterized protein UREG_01052 [Uncinocarpus reesii 1704]EEP76203.1 conserved hypothetical protein [Uncinocarpus reesii 1704]
MLTSESDEVDDHSRDEERSYRAIIGFTTEGDIIEPDFPLAVADDQENADEEDDDEPDEGEEDGDEDEDMDDAASLLLATRDDSDVEMNTEDDLEAGEATLAGYPRPPPPPARTREEERVAAEMAAILINPSAYEGWPEASLPIGRGEAAGEDENEEPEGSRAQGENHDASNSSVVKIPKTPGFRMRKLSKALPYWEIKPARYHSHPIHPYEDIRKRKRLDCSH